MMLDKSNCNKSAFVGLSGPHHTLAVSVRDPQDNTDYAMAVEWTTPLSVDPPLFGIVISQDKKTHEVIKETGIFAVNILPVERLKEIWGLGTRTAKRQEDKLSRVGLTAVEGTANRHAISIEEAAASFECRVKDEIQMGGFTLFVGEVLAAQAADVVYDTREDMWVPENIGFIFHVASDVFVTNQKSIVQPRK
ncbi:flavin reductase family protein [Candidatus Thorarchaeota archaeon]|nr:MAG: flavin reductase family protein [Candidatus Thorarchaeota archaeon]